MAIAGVDKQTAVPSRGRAADLALVGIGVTLVTLGGKWTGAGAVTVGFLFLLFVLGLSVWRGLFSGSAGAIVATLCYNYFFFPPFGTLTIADPANWVALGAFLVTAVVVSRLVVRARRRADEAHLRALETQILYELSFGLFTTTSRLGTVGDATATCLRTIGANGGGLVLFRDGRAAPVIVDAIGSRTIDPEHPMLAAVAEQREVLVGDADGERIAYIPLQVGETVIGILVATGTVASRPVLESAGRLMALAVERERLLTETTELEALKASDVLKTSLLRAVSHDLRTPLTAIRLEMDRLVRDLGDRPDVAPILGALSAERERLTRRIDNLLAMARLESGVIEPHPEPTPAASLFGSACESLAAILSKRPVEIRIDPACPDLYVDPGLVLEVIVNLLENAARATPSGGRLELTAASDPEDVSRVQVEVLDRGPGIPHGLSGARFDLGARSRSSGDSGPAGLGLEIATSLARACGGGFTVHPRPGGGTIARVVLPAALTPSTAEASR